MAVTRHKISVVEYDKMVGAGIFHEDQRIELILGELVEMTPVGTPHQSKIDRLTYLFITRLGRRATVRIQGPVVIGEYSEPQPDVLLLAPRDDFYAAVHPAPADVLLLIEVADSSLKFDRSVKASLYESEGVREYWIVNVVDDVLEVHRRPAPATPFQKSVLGRGHSVAPTAFPDLVVPIEELLGL